ncbi:MAG: ABC transporter permease [Chitinophagaceae bacterium]|nr:ABC transporter permease [Chitinophagaceae bacterium]
MIRNYLKIATRNFSREKFVIIINVVGLSMGMAVTLLIGLWIWDEYSFDTYFQNHKKIAVAMSTQTWNGETTTTEGVAVPLAYQLQNNYNEYFKRIALTSEEKSYVISKGEKKFLETGIWVQKDFPELFSLKLINGTSAGFSDPSSVLISESVANALFGTSNPVNETIRIDNKINLKVIGVFADLPFNTRFFNIKILLPWENVENRNNQEASWSNHHFRIYAELYDANKINIATSQIKNICKSFITQKTNEELLLHPVDKAHLYDKFSNGKVVGGRVQFVKLFGIIGIFVLLLACINFMNISTARSGKRAKEVGIRKSLGSLRVQLIVQFLFEALLVTFCAVVVSLSLVIIFLPIFNVIADKHLSFPWALPGFWIAILFFTFIISILAGSYPAFYLSAFSPQRVLKGTYEGSSVNASLFRKILVTIQFTISISLIIGTIIVFKQVMYAKNKNVGYSRDGLISVEVSAPEIFNQYNSVRSELLATGAVLDMTGSSSPATNVNNNMVNFDWKGRDPSMAPLIGLVAVTHDFGNTIEWRIKDGRDFSRSFPSDSTDEGAYILNEAAVKLTGLKKPVGDRIKFGDKDHIILGVIDDIIMKSPYSSIEPTIFWLNYDWRIKYLTIKLKPGYNIHNALNKVETVLKKYSPESIFNFRFVDEEYSKKYFDEVRIGRLATLFTLFAITISCLGLFGLTTFTAEQRTKEIGIRKVLGASILNIWFLLTKEFILIVSLAIAIAIPISWLLLSTWLQNYEYRTSISWSPFALAGIGALCITFFTTCFQIFKIARMNPVNSLKVN